MAGSVIERKKPAEESVEEAEIESNSEDEEEEASTDEESDESSSEDDEPVMLKPVFISKSNRNARGDKPQTPDISRNERTLQSIEHNIRAENELKRSQQAQDFGGVEDVDDLDAEKEYSEWKLRELTRVKRERDRVEARELEQDELDKRRDMTEEELEKEFRDKREREDLERNKDDEVVRSGKYYHKGAYYQEEELLKRDYSGVVEDEVVKRVKR